LFLVLSSHGARNAMIEVSNLGVAPLGLSASTVRSMLDEAGIGLRVIVVSACFSGSFVKPLATNNTIVLTAAARDRASFGCSDDRHLTYFGEAFFSEALPRASSLRSAFESTRRAILQREKAERIRPSQPQAHFGPVAETVVDELLAKKGPAPDR
jgi:hypothetical protein